MLKKRIQRFYDQVYIQIDLNFTSNSTSILHPIRPHFYVQFDLNFTSNSTSILHPIRPQFYVQFDLNFTSNLIPMGQLFFADGTKLGGHETPTRDSRPSSALCNLLPRSGRIHQPSTGTPLPVRPSAGNISGVQFGVGYGWYVDVRPT